MRDDGGPAFPVSGDTLIRDHFDGEVLGREPFTLPGMTLRDYFAAAALTGIITAPRGPAGDWEQCARDAFAAADAMLAERREAPDAED